MGYAIPVDVVREVADQLAANGKIIRAGLGITGRTAAEGEFGTNSPVGIYVDTVNTGEAAYNAGIKKGDVIYKYNGEQLKNFNQLVAILATLKPEDKIKLTIYREDNPSLELDVTLTQLSE